MRQFQIRLILKRDVIPATFTVGFQGKMKIYKGLGLETSINQSILLGKVKYSGLFRDIDDIWAVQTPQGPYYPFNYYYYEGRFPFEKKENVALPVTELKLKVAYGLTKNISLGVGGFASIWWNAPLAPRWSIPGNWTAGDGTGWNLPNKTTLTFYGLTTSLTIQF